MKTAAQAIDGNYLLEDRGYHTPCWIWQRGKSGVGRPMAYVTGRNMLLAYRLTYELFVGPVPENTTLDHLCCEPTCINPNHLEAVTDRENRRRAGQVKLTDEQVREIRRLLAETDLYQREIGDLFGVCDATISLINTRTNWASLV